MKQHKEADKRTLKDKEKKTWNKKSNAKPKEDKEETQHKINDERT
nr:hypothetical protein [Mycoplasmopsis bovis]